jgi:hypothetical protein
MDISFVKWDSCAEANLRFFKFKGEMEIGLCAHRL